MNNIEKILKKRCPDSFYWTPANLDSLINADALKSKNVSKDLPLGKASCILVIREKS